ncbi:hypothetical protein B0T21DRAFT_455954 [Apiosordaria backusii]|uniref:Uncharacterized protein n=1 Tax=Apiosordaria backusii TaxID=314023 RepID=A0AA39ZPE4_9PEZI|nr:hypothetical protein B0T21DRAFT_455954 [Apiosordaria backusii]
MTPNKPSTSSTCLALSQGASGVQPAFLKLSRSWGEPRVQPKNTAPQASDMDSVGRWLSQDIREEPWTGFDAVAVGSQVATYNMVAGADNKDSTKAENGSSKE